MFLFFRKHCSSIKKYDVFYDTMISIVGEDNLSASSTFRFSYTVSGERIYENPSPISELKERKIFLKLLCEKEIDSLENFKIHFFDSSEVKLLHFDFESNSPKFTTQEFF